MTLGDVVEQIGDGAVLAVGGLAVGLAFGALAQQSRFCLRAATVEVSRGALGPKLAIWLVAFGAAVVARQGLILGGALDVSHARQIVARGSISGALLGGAMYEVEPTLPYAFAAVVYVILLGFMQWIGRRVSTHVEDDVTG